MRVALAIALAAILSASSAFAQDGGVSTDATSPILADRLDRDRQGVAISASIVDGDVPAFAAHGLLDSRGDVPVDATTLFEIGSVSKIFTNLLLAQMVLEGRMDLDRPVADYLPGGAQIPTFQGRPITLFDLATHRSGLPSIPPEIALADPSNPYQYYDADLLYAFLRAYHLPRAPGEQFEYSNIGVTLIGEAVSHVTGQPYGEMVQQRILDPLGMTETMLVVPDTLAARFATGHDRNGQPVPHWNFDVFAPAGGYRSTTTDMAKFIAAASGQVSTPLDAAFSLMLERTRPAGSDGMSIGLGWMLRETDGSTIVWHNGMTAGFNSFAGFDRSAKRGAVVLANAITDTGIEDIGFHLIDADIPLNPQPKPRAAVAVDPAVLQAHAGTYALAPDFAITVTEQDGHLYIQATGQERFEAFPETETEFFLKVVDAQITFARDAEGRTTGLVLHQNGRDMEGTRQ